MIPKKFDELRLTGALPSPSAVGIRILDLTQNDDFSIDELARTVMIDGALSGRIVKLANSAAETGRSPATSVTEAIKRLGANRLRTVALGFTLVSDNRSGRCEAFNYDRYWAQSLACAVAAHVLVSRTGDGDPLEAFTVGLVAGIGQLALACVHPATYSKLLGAHPGADEGVISDLEIGAFGIGHAEVAAALMEDWGLPDSMVEAVISQPSEKDGPEQLSLASVLSVAQEIAGVLVDDGDHDAERWRGRFEHINHVAEKLEISAEDVCELCEAVHEAWKEWGQLLEIPTDSGTEVADLIKLWTVSTEEGEGAAVDVVSEGAEADPPSPDSEFKAPTRILLIDDDDRMLRLLRHHLVKDGYEVFTATSSEEGLQKALQLSPQIVITDWMMPGMSGVRLCAVLRQTVAGRRMYVLLVTAREDDEQVVEAFEAGADDYIVKPFNPRILMARVHAGQRMIRMREQVEAAERERLKQVAELGIMTRKLRAAALTDPLTELPNRRYAMDRLRQEWDSSMRTGRPLSVVMLDLDHFKRVNDNHGHDVGDVVLRASSSAMRGAARSADVLCRLGGEEFLAITVGCDGEHSSSLAERMRQAVEEMEIESDGQSLKVTVSLGVAQKASSMSGIDDLLKAADEALYMAKASGRNKVWLASLGDEAKSA